MNTLKIAAVSQDGSNQHVHELHFDLDSFRSMPNPRQALVAHFLILVRAAIADVDPSITI